MSERNFNILVAPVSRTEVKGQNGRWQQSRRAAERQGDWQSGRVSLGTAEKTSIQLDRVPVQVPTWLGFHQVGLFSVVLSGCHGETP